MIVGCLFSHFTVGTESKMAITKEELETVVKELLIQNNEKQKKEWINMVEEIG